jgi:hypothetical protein
MFDTFWFVMASPSSADANLPPDGHTRARMVPQEVTGKRNHPALRCARLKPELRISTHRVLV